VFDNHSKTCLLPREGDPRRLRAGSRSHRPTRTKGRTISRPRRGTGASWWQCRPSSPPASSHSTCSSELSRLRGNQRRGNLCCPSWLGKIEDFFLSRTAARVRLRGKKASFLFFSFPFPPSLSFDDFPPLFFSPFHAADERLLFGDEGEMGATHKSASAPLPADP